MRGAWSSDSEMRGAWSSDSEMRGAWPSDSNEGEEGCSMVESGPFADGFVT